MWKTVARKLTKTMTRVDLSAARCRAKCSSSRTRNWTSLASEAVDVVRVVESNEVRDTALRRSAENCGLQTV